MPALYHAALYHAALYRSPAATGAVMSPSHPEVSNEVLMMRYQTGDRDALATLVLRHKTPMYNFFLRQLRDRCLAEDMVQDLFVKLVRKAGTFKHEARFTTWVYAIARNLCIDQMRKLSLRRHPSLDARTAPDGPTLGERVADEHPTTAADRSAVSADIASRVTTAVEALPAEQREVFLLRQLAGVPFKEIANITGVSENTAKSRMRYALERLQTALCDYEDYARALR
jgi:RNA polymerase sigma-70 factor (ECF subfamily)